MAGRGQALADCSPQVGRERAHWGKTKGYPKSPVYQHQSRPTPGESVAAETPPSKAPSNRCIVIPYWPFYNNFDLIKINN